VALVEAKLEEEKNVAEVSAKAPAALSVKNVLFATDFSFTSESARPYAIALCRYFGSTLHTAHVVSEVSIVAMTGGVDYVGLSTLYEDARSQAKEKLSQICGRLRGILKIAAKCEADLIVLGARASEVGNTHLPWSTAHHVIARAHCPVLTIRG
jgi:nucleotide-binding universal stress UspA family protein